MRWVLVGGIIFAFFVVPFMFRSCSEAEGDRFRNQFHHSLEEHRGRPVDSRNNQPAKDSWDW